LAGGGADEGPELEGWAAARQREYLPGFGRMGFMWRLKALIDPSHFRVEEQRLRGLAFEFARRLVLEAERSRELDLSDAADFYNTVDSLFLVRDGEIPIQVDHSLAYRHRNRRRYPYREFTPQELTGIIASIHRDVFGPPTAGEVVHAATYQVADWPEMVAWCFGGGIPEIDDRDFLYERLGQNVPVAIFPGALMEHELEVFVLQTARRRLGLGIHDELQPKHIRRLDRLAPITIIERREPLPGGVSAAVTRKDTWERGRTGNSGFSTSAAPVASSPANRSRWGSTSVSWAPKSLGYSMKSAQRRASSSRCALTRR